MAVDCTEIEVRDQGLSVTFPGGARVTAQVPTAGGPTPLVLTKQLMAQCSAVLAPLKPTFDIIAAILAIKDFAEAVPQLVTNPSAVVEAVANLIEKVAKLAALIPQLSVPLMILGLVDLIIAYLNGMLEELTALSAQQGAIATAQAIADDQGLSELQDAVDCATDQLAAQLANLQAGAGPVDELIEVINIFVGLVPGLPEIPTIGAMPDDIDESVDFLTDLVAVLNTVRDAIPI